MILHWRCEACGERSYLHHENCDGCGKPRPPPPPEAPPGHDTKPEPFR